MLEFTQQSCAKEVEIEVAIQKLGDLIQGKEVVGVGLGVVQNPQNLALTLIIGGSVLQADQSCISTPDRPAPRRIRHEGFATLEKDALWFWLKRNVLRTHC